MQLTTISRKNLPDFEAWTWVNDHINHMAFLFGTAGEHIVWSRAQFP